jgi:hypothetical protein
MFVVLEFKELFYIDIDHGLFWIMMKQKYQMFMHIQLLMQDEEHHNEL